MAYLLICAIKKKKKTEKEIRNIAFQLLLLTKPGNGPYKTNNIKTNITKRGVIYSLDICVLIYDL